MREHLGIGRWLVTGVSWGCTLAQAYALQHPSRVMGLVLMAVTTTSRAEVDWITDKVGRVFPEAWDEFRRSSQHRPGERLVEAYARRLTGGDAEDRLFAARAWNAWEDAHISLMPTGQTSPLYDERRERNFATLVAHYWANDRFLPGERAILNRIDQIGHVPAVLIHARKDVGGPAVTAWELHRRWSASELIMVEDEGHGGPVMVDAMIDAIGRLAR